MSNLIIDDNKREEYFTIFKQLQQEPIIKESINDKILIIDFLNTWIRSFCGSPALNVNGLHIGGVSGFLYSIGLAIRTFNPTRCILVSDGENSAARKRQIYSDYKNQRKVKFNLNRQYEFDDIDDTEQMKREMMILLRYLEYMPVQMVIADSTEADDTISHISTNIFTNSKIVIMSSDKDFLQLVDDRINVWSPTKKKLYTRENIKSEYGIHANNFLFYRMLDGDKSDDIPGVNGIGLKKILKYLPILTQENTTSINEIIEYSNKMNNKKKNLQFYDNISNSIDILERNEKLMNLKNPNISEHNKASIRNQLNKKIPQLNKSKIITLYIADGLSNAMPDLNGWIYSTLHKLNSFAMTYEGEK